MGVHGLWRIIEPAGKPVPPETLENKILAIDVSIWLHQAIKGFQDSRGAPIPNAHLLGIYHRVCKLLYFKIKPVFVFDGGVPALKKETISKRNQSRSKLNNDATRIQKQLMETLIKHTALNKVLADKIEASISNEADSKLATKNSRFDMYKLPESTEIESSFSTVDDEESMESTEDTSESSPVKHLDLHSIDMESKHFKSLPADIRHEILSDLKETRKQSSWGRLHELPTQSDDFAVYQMKRLLKRQAVQTALESTEKEMGGKSLSLAELEVILTDQGVINDPNVGNRIASDENKRYLFIKNIEQAIIEKKQTEMKTIEEEDEKIDSTTLDVEKIESKKSIAQKEFEDDMERAIKLSLEDSKSLEKVDLIKTDIPSTSKENMDILSDNEDDDLKAAIQLSLESHTSSNKNQFSFLNEISGLEFESSSSEDESTEILQKKVESAKNYMMEYSGLTPSEIEKIISGNKTKNVESNKKKELKETVTVESTTKSDKESVDEVEIMSTSSDSDNSSDFVEISSKNESENKESFEIIVDTQNSIEDDIFSDIFQKSENISSTTESTSNKDISSVEIEKVPEIITVSEINDDKKLEDEKKLVKNKSKPKISVEELQSMKKQLEEAKEELIIERQTKERMAGNITEQMMQEAQALLELFGIPYVVAPMEAEAQCAFLDKINLTNGTITDDSDIWLFGGNTVYKNFFNHSKYVMEFSADNIQRNFKLTQEQMILLALLVGSDYTLGIQGVGPVTALEILAAFPPAKIGNVNVSHRELLTGLQEFRSWCSKGKAPGPGRSSLRSKLKNVTFIDNFPSLNVLKAYLEPTVETSKEPFSWGKPDISGLVQFAKEKFGWTKMKSEEILMPVLNRLADSKTQKSIRDFFTTTHKLDVDVSDKVVSKRMKTAIQNMGRDPSEIIAEDLKKELKTKKTKNMDDNSKKTRQKRTKSDKNVDNNKSSEDIPKKRTRKTTTVKNTQKNEENNQPSTSKETTENEPEVSKDVLTKIQQIRKRRQLNTAKAKILEKEKLEKVLKQPEKPKKSEEELILDTLIEESQKRVEEIETKLKDDIEKKIGNKTPTKSIYFRTGRKEIIPQKERNKSELLRNKLKAIEVFRKSKKGPGYVEKRNLRKRAPKDEAGLSESSSDE